MGGTLETGKYEEWDDKKQIKAIIDAAKIAKAIADLDKKSASWGFNNMPYGVSDKKKPDSSPTDEDFAILKARIKYLEDHLACQDNYVNNLQNHIRRSR